MAGLTVTDPGTPTLGTVEIAPDGTLTYTPNPDTNGVDEFTYTISDGTQESSAKVTITIHAIADVPVADDQDITPAVLHATSRTITLMGSDVDSASLTFAIGTGPIQGDLGALGTPVCTPLGGGVTCTVDVLYTAHAGGSGPDEFSFTVNDGALTSPVGTISLDVLGAIVVDAGSDTGGAEGSAVALSGSVTPSDGATTTWTAVAGAGVDAGATCTFGDASALATSVTCTDDGSWTVTLTADDPGPDSPVANDLILRSPTRIRRSTSRAPADGAVVPAGSSVAVTATVADAGSNDPLTCSIDWGNTTVTAGSIAAGVCTGSHAYTSPGPFTIKVGAADDDAGSGSDTVGIVVDINDAPSFTKGADQSAPEDSGARSVTGWASAISPGPANEAGQQVTFQVVSNSNAALFSAGPAVSSAGVLTYTPAANANGIATIVIHLRDDGGTANGGHDVSADQSFVIVVRPVNDAPSFTKGANQSVLEDSLARTVSGWATAISRGPIDEAGQTVSFTISSNDHPAFFSAGPAISPTGTLTYTPAANAAGIATIGVQIHDNGGVVDGGSDVSAEATFTITLGAVNDPPSFTKGANQTVAEDAGAQSVAGWASAISKGPADEAGQTVAFEIVTNTNAALFSTAPAIGPTGTLTYTSAPNASGTATITIRLRDSGGVLNGGNNVSPNQSFTITVTPVNDPPTANAGADVTIDEGKSASLRGSGIDPEGGGLKYTWTQGARTFNRAPMRRSHSGQRRLQCDAHGLRQRDARRMCHGRGPRHRSERRADPQGEGGSGRRRAHRHLPPVLHRELRPRDDAGDRDGRRGRHPDLSLELRGWDRVAYPSRPVHAGHAARTVRRDGHGDR